MSVFHTEPDCNCRGRAAAVLTQRMVLKETIRSIRWGGPPLSLSHTHTQTHTCTVHGLVPTFCHPYEITEVFKFLEGLEQNLWRDNRLQMGQMGVSRQGRKCPVNCGERCLFLCIKTPRLRFVLGVYQVYMVIYVQSTRRWSQSAGLLERSSVTWWHASFLSNQILYFLNSWRLEGFICKPCAIC